MANCGFHMNKYLGIFEHVPLFLNIQTIAQKYSPSIKFSWFSWKCLTKKVFWDLSTFTDLDEKLKKVKLRRASTSDLDQQSIYLEAEKGQSLKIKKRIKEFQKKHLLAAHEALWGVLGEMKAKGEVRIFFIISFYLDLSLK